KKARDLGYRIVDATCPMVKEIHKISKAMENKCQKIIIIGDKKHAEVKGIIGHLKRNPLVIDKPSNIPFKKIKKIKKACMVIQSTQNQENVGKIFNLLKQHIKDLKLFNTICNTTKAKQKEIMTLPLENDIMIIIGSKISANTRRLYEISKNLNSRTFWIDSETQLRKDWFKKAKTVGIHAGASTPDYIIEKIVKIIRRISKSPAE
ncbi:MAG: 4-hydroxy-3-methylbut-2-enyl diphosphate reductase, partial [Candidatus Omnitrophica bacterium]|nr:4-hydroxy-3-methylbut-2-enyl diphosphate reductase [Candidatus Omnitrophota bacterium]